MALVFAIGEVPVNPVVIFVWTTLIIAFTLDRAGWESRRQRPRHVKDLRRAAYLQQSERSRRLDVAAGTTVGWRVLGDPPSYSTVR
ncbi:MAG TPA: hypothetical protein VG318_00465 [Actinomycetota bacterium]|nr:hypothetical protein [Actinomycetota bacterium]